MNLIGNSPVAPEPGQETPARAPTASEASTGTASPSIVGGAGAASRSVTVRDHSTSFTDGPSARDHCGSKRYRRTRQATHGPSHVTGRNSTLCITDMERYTRIERTYAAVDTCRMAKTPEPPNPTRWKIYEIASKGVSLGEVEAPDEAAAIEKAVCGIQGAR
jgi:hypothetical protein